MALETFEAGYAGARPTRTGNNQVWTGLWRLSQMVDRIIDNRWPVPWGLGSARKSVPGVSFSVTTQETNPTGVSFKPDGTKFYVVGSTNNTVYQYSCSTAWAVSTASYDSKSFSVSTVGAQPVQDIFFKSDGTKFYISSNYAGSGLKGIYQYSCSTAWDVTTATIDTYYATASTIGAGVTPWGVFFKPDGTKLYIVTSTTRIYQYTCSTAWDLNTVSSDGISLNVSTQATNPRSIFFKSDGTKVYVIDTTTKALFQYSCSTAWNVSTASYDNTSFVVAGQETDPQGISFKDDGTTAFVVGTTADTVFQYTLPTAWSVTYGTYDGGFYTGTQEGSPGSLFFKSDGANFYTVGQGNKTVYQYACSTAWDVSTSSYSSKSFSVNTQETAPTGVFFKSDGTTFYIIGTTSDTVFQYTCSTAWDVSTASYASKSFSITAQETNPQEVFFKSDGTKFYIVGSTNNTVYQYSCSTAWDVSTASYDSKSFSVVAQDTAVTGLFFKDDGTKFYIVGNTNDSIYQYSCSTAWDVSTASYAGVSFSVNAQENAPVSISFKSDGTKLYMFGQTQDYISQYSLALN